MRQGKVFFHPIEGSGLLSISWDAGPKGSAIEAKKGAGVGFFSREGKLLSVIFDEIDSSEDHQFLEFAAYKVEVVVKNGKVTYKVQNKSPLRKKPKRIAAVKRKSSVKIKR